MNTHRTTSTTAHEATLSGAIEEREPQCLSAHPKSALLPALESTAFAEFCVDVRERGLLVPLEVTAENVVLDGHVRLHAALALKLDRVPVRVIAPEDEVVYLLGAALKRRHLTASQRAALVVELEQYQQAKSAAAERSRGNLKQRPGGVATLPPRGKTRDQAAAWANVSPRTIQDAATVQAADPKLFAEVKSGRIPADRAARRVRQQQRDAQLDAAPPLPDGLYDAILGDPPWRVAGTPDSSRAVENHYPTMPTSEICALRVPAADDAILFLWAVNSMLPEALQVIEAWGFAYVNQFVWVKDKWGLGSYNRCQHELLLVAVRGQFSAPAENKRFSSVINAPRTKHSAKPPCVYEMVEAMYPRARKLELFARTAREGWTCWGNQAPAAEEPA